MDRLETHPLPLLVTPLGQVEADLLVVPAFEGDDFADVAGLDAATSGEVGRAITNHEFSGKPYELFLTPVAHNWKARRVALVGAGPRARFDTDLARRVATTGVLAARTRRISRVVVLFRTSGDPSHPSRTPDRLLQGLAEGAVLAQQEGGSHKSSPNESPRVADVRVIAPELRASDKAVAAAAVERGRILGECTNVARDLGNEPSNLLTPRVLAERAQLAAAGTSLSVQVLDEKEIEARKIGLLLGVARG